MGVFLYTRHTWCIHTPHAHCRVITWVSSYTPHMHTPHAHCRVITWVSSYTPDTHGVFIHLMLTVEL